MSKVFLVTGSSRGLGREIVTAALAAGHLVMAQPATRAPWTTWCPPTGIGSAPRNST
ncbi:hypothetical protein AB0919_29355 [Streptomyces sp. NPDC046994]|uniref:hypothetical protein n=1 Tax=Streptomyces sp. NPDC046994 TaxID=3155735 RepID=UPI0034554D84